jgi:hypothetical protein
MCLLPKIVCNEIANHFNCVVNCKNEDRLTLMVKEFGLSISLELLAQRHVVTFEKTCIFGTTAQRTSDLVI